MMQGTRLGLLGLLLAGLSAAWVTPAPAQDGTGQTAVTQAMPSYRPPLRGAPASRIGGAHRGAEGDDWTLLVLAPEHTGLTTSARPTLYWYTSQAVDQPIEVTLIERGAIDPLLEHTLPGPVAAGVQPLSLAGLGIELAPGKEYQWFVSVVVDPGQRSKDYAAGASIERVPLDPQIQAQLRDASADREAFVYAEAGLWYDAIDALSRRADPATRAQRRALIEQVGLQMPTE